MRMNQDKIQRCSSSVGEASNKDVKYWGVIEPPFYINLLHYHLRLGKRAKLKFIVK